MLLFPIVPVRKKIQFNKRTTVLGTSKNFSFERFSLDLICYCLEPPPSVAGLFRRNGAIAEPRKACFLRCVAKSRPKNIV